MSHLRVVTDQPPSTPNPKVRRRFSHEDRAKLAVALRNLRRSYPNWAALAADLGVDKSTLGYVLRGHCGSMALVVSVARLARTSVEQILSGILEPANRCPACGQGRPS